MFWRDKCFGSATVGPKGEIVIPAEARKEFGISRGQKLLLFGRPEFGVLLMIEASRVGDLISSTLEELTHLSATFGLETKERK